MEPNVVLAMLGDDMDKRAPRVQKLRAYARGEQTLPEGSKSTQEAWKAFQKLARTNWGGLVVSALAERVTPAGIVVSDDTNAETHCRRIWRDNRMDSVWSQCLDDWLTCGEGYLMVSQGTQGQAIITAEAPEQVITRPDPLQPWRTMMAVKMWRDRITKTDTALVWTSGLRTTFTRTATEDTPLKWSYTHGWKPTGEQLPYAGDPPVFRLYTPNGLGEFEQHISLIDRITRSTLERLVTAAIQAFRQRAIQVEEGSELPETDEKGEPIDYTKMFEAGPGALWELPPGVKIWESAQTMLEPMLAATKEDIRQLCAVTRTPVPVLMPDAANQSAEGANAIREGLIAKANERIANARPTLEGVLKRALETENIPLEGSIKVAFKPPAIVSLTERYAAATAAKAAGESWESICRNILGYSEEQIAADRIARAGEALNMALMVHQTRMAPDGSTSGCTLG